MSATSESPYRIREAIPVDAEALCAMFHELAVFEGLEALVFATPERVLAELLAQPRLAQFDVCESAGRVVAFSAWFYSFSTFEAKRGIFVEDVYVQKSHRGRGIATRLLARLARRCSEEELPRLDWRVLTWNEEAIRLFEQIEAKQSIEWTFCRVQGEPMKRLAERA